MRRHRTIRTTVVAVCAATMLALAVTPAFSDPAVVTSGEVNVFAAGTGDPAYAGVTGHARMVRTADDKTIVTLHIRGLAPNTSYGSHVHAARCEVGDANGHYKHDPSGPPTPPNEIWPAFTTNADGIGNGKDTAEWRAGPTAVSVVVHAPGGAKIACANLE